MLYLVVGTEVISDKVIIKDSDKYSKHGLDAPEYFDDEQYAKAEIIFVEKYPNVFDLYQEEINGDTFTIEAKRLIKDIIEAEDKESAEKVYYSRHPSTGNKRFPISVYTVEEWQSQEI